MVQTPVNTEMTKYLERIKSNFSNEWEKQCSINEQLSINIFGNGQCHCNNSKTLKHDKEKKRKSGRYLSKLISNYKTKQKKLA